MPYRYRRKDLAGYSGAEAHHTRVCVAVNAKTGRRRIIGFGVDDDDAWMGVMKMLKARLDIDHLPTGWALAIYIIGP